MADTGKRDFNQDAKTWDDSPHRLRMAQDIAGAILSRVPITQATDLMDYGAGTGLVTLYLQPHARSVLAADSAQGMLDQLNDKTRAGGLTNVNTTLLDLEHDPVPDTRFDVIVSSMTFHHITDIAALLRRMRAMLRPGGYLAVADLDSDDGEFHRDPTGVKHEGFDRAHVTRLFAESGFGEVTVETAHTLARPVEGKGMRDFPIFLATGRRI